MLGINEKYPIYSLIELKHSKYSGSIHTISADKFFIHNWAPHQLIVYKHIQKSYCTKILNQLLWSKTKIIFTNTYYQT